MITCLFLFVNTIYEKKGKKLQKEHLRKKQNIWLKKEVVPKKTTSSSY
jgi:hypothetical protein